MKKNRIWELDFLRGFAIVMVTVDHAMYDFCCMFPAWRRSDTFLKTLYELGRSYLYGDLRVFWRPAFLFLFFCVSGLCTAFSRNNFIRGARLFVVAALVSLVTYVVQTVAGVDCFILFGVLHCLALVTLAYAACDGLVRLVFKLVSKKKTIQPIVRKIVKVVVMLLFTAAFFVINQKFNVRLNDVFVKGSVIGYENDWRGLFFYEISWWTADYFPLFPYIAFFFLGAALAEVLYPKRKSLLPRLDGKWHYVFSVPGRFSLPIYLMGQVVVIGICYLLNLCLT